MKGLSIFVHHPFLIGIGLPRSRTNICHCTADDGERPVYELRTYQLKLGYTTVARFRVLRENWGLDKLHPPRFHAKKHGEIAQINFPGGSPGGVEGSSSVPGSEFCWKIHYWPERQAWSRPNRPISTCDLARPDSDWDDHPRRQTPLCPLVVAVAAKSCEQTDTQTSCNSCLHLSSVQSPCCLMISWGLSYPIYWGL